MNLIFTFEGDIETLTGLKGLGVINPITAKKHLLCCTKLFGHLDQLALHNPCETFLAISSRVSRAWGADGEAKEWIVQVKNKDEIVWESEQWESKIFREC